MILKNGAWQAEIRPEFGMNTVSLQYRGEELLRRPESREVLEKNPFVYGFPLQLPANRTADGCFRSGGKTYTLPINDPARHCHIHGCLGRTPFQVVEAKECSLRADLENRGEVFPLPFRLEVCFRLENDGYRQEFTFRNTGEQLLPLSFGLHSTFRTPGFLAVDIGRKLCRDERLLPTGEFAPHNAPDRALKQGFDAGSHGWSDAYEMAGHTARLGDFLYRVSENFSHWMIWNPAPGNDFFCIEPQCGAANALQNGLGLQLLPPGESVTFQASLCRL